MLAARSEENQNNVSLAAIGEQLPLADGCIDRIYSLNALTFYSDPKRHPENALKWASEIARVLKPTGEAVLGPCPHIKQATADYKEIIPLLTEMGYKISFEPIDHPSFVAKYGSLPKDKWPTRLIIKKLNTP